MKYCTRCLYPETKPDLVFNSAGECSACQAFDARSGIDWETREKNFVKLVHETRQKARDNEVPYDCIVPVSGGKDSHYQVLTALDYGLRVLAVTAETDHLSDLGRRNLDNIAKLGVDHIEIKTNPVIRRKINRFALETVGDISWPEHITIFSIPVRIACMFRVPLIIWGENSQNEYGGPMAKQNSTKLDRQWLNEFGGLNGLRVKDLEEMIGPIGELYHYPELKGLEMLTEDMPEGIFLGQFFPWDGLSNARRASKHGFELFDQPNVEGSYGNYENLDNHQTGIHDYFKYIKFGFGRATDILNNHIRRGKITRKDAIPIVAERDGMFPAVYLGKPIKEILKPLEMDVGQFLEICDTFTNWTLFEGSHQKGNLRPKFDVGVEAQDGQAA